MCIYIYIYIYIYTHTCSLAMRLARRPVGFDSANGSDIASQSMRSSSSGA